MLTQANSYGNFLRNNEILFSTKIVRGQGVAVNGPYYEDHRVGRADVIDVNQDYRAELQEESAGLLRKRFMYNEPVLDTSVDRLQSVARVRGEEIVTKESVDSPLMVKSYGVDAGRTAFQSIEGVERNFRTLDRLVNEVTGDHDAQWAISPSTREFFIYKPGSQAVEEPAPAPAPPEPLKVSQSETDDYLFRSVHAQGDGHFTVFMQDDESFALHASDGREIRLDDAVPETMREGVTETLRAAMADPDFAIESVRITKNKHTGDQDFMVMDAASYYEYSSKSGLQSGELGS